MKQQICECLNKLSQESKSVFVWFRDDDVSVFTKQLNSVIRYFSDKRTEILLAVIPNLISEPTVQVIRKNPMLLVGQHGFNHIDYSKNGEEKSEYPKSRSLEEALNEIDCGRRILIDLFPDSFGSVFVPPYFEIDVNYLNRISESYKWFSGWWTNSVDEKVVFVNAQVDFVNWSIAKKFAGSHYVEQQLAHELELLEKSSYLSSVIGVVLHHDYCDYDTFQTLDWLYFLREQYVNFHIISPNDAYALVKSRLARIR